MAKKLPAFLTACALVPASLLMAADKKKDSNEPARETIAKPMSEKEKRKREEKLRKELEGPFRKWLNEDVFYIITDEERATFKRFGTDEEREQFIEQFWLRRDPKQRERALLERRRLGQQVELRVRDVCQPNPVLRQRAQVGQ